MGGSNFIFGGGGCERFDLLLIRSYGIKGSDKFILVIF